MITIRSIGLLVFVLLAAPILVSSSRGAAASALPADPGSLPRASSADEDKPFLR